MAQDTLARVLALSAGKGEKGDPGPMGPKGEDGTQVAVSETGTATEEVKYITIDGTEYKLAGSGTGGEGFTVIDYSGYGPIAIEDLDKIIANPESILITTVTGTVEVQRIAYYTFSGMQIIDSSTDPSTAYAYKSIYNSTNYTLTVDTLTINASSGAVRLRTLKVPHYLEADGSVIIDGSLLKVNVDNNTIVVNEDGQLTAKGGGGGGSAEVDGKSIVVGEDGKLKTAVGGYREHDFYGLEFTSDDSCRAFKNIKSGKYDNLVENMFNTFEAYVEYPITLELLDMFPEYEGNEYKIVSADILKLTDVFDPNSEQYYSVHYTCIQNGELIDTIRELCIRPDSFEAVATIDIGLPFKRIRIKSDLLSMFENFAYTKIDGKYLDLTGGKGIQVDGGKISANIEYSKGVQCALSDDGKMSIQSLVKYPVVVASDRITIYNDKQKCRAFPKAEEAGVYYTFNEATTEEINFIEDTLEKYHRTHGLTELKEAACLMTYSDDEAVESEYDAIMCIYQNTFDIDGVTYSGFGATFGFGIVGYYKLTRADDESSEPIYKVVTTVYGDTRCHHEVYCGEIYGYESAEGGKQLYNHNIHVDGSSMTAYATIVTDSETPFTETTLIAYLKNNNFYGGSPDYYAVPASGYCWHVLNEKMGIVTGIHTDVTGLSVQCTAQFIDNSGSLTSNAATVSDHVVAI